LIFTASSIAPNLGLPFIYVLISSNSIKNSLLPRVISMSNMILLMNGINIFLCIFLMTVWLLFNRCRIAMASLKIWRESLCLILKFNTCLFVREVLPLLWGAWQLVRYLAGVLDPARYFGELLYVVFYVPNCSRHREIDLVVCVPRKG